MTANELIQKRNKIAAEIAAIENNISENNKAVLFSEILNLRDGVGDNFIEEDDHAEARYYSSIPGVKNIRFGRHDHEDKTTLVLVKIESPAGKLLLAEDDPFLLDGSKYRLGFISSKYATDEVDY